MVRDESQQEKETMRTSHFVKGDYDDRLCQLAGEVAKQAIDDVRMLQRRGVLDGLTIKEDFYKDDISLNDCQEYRNIQQVRKLVKDFKNGVVWFWCRAAGVHIDNRSLLRRMREMANA